MDSGNHPLEKEVASLQRHHGVDEAEARGMWTRNRLILQQQSWLMRSGTYDTPGSRIPDKYLKALKILHPDLIGREPSGWFDEQKAADELMALDLQPWGPGTGDHATRLLLQWRRLCPDWLYQLPVLLGLGYSENEVWQILEDY